ncbi:MAG: chemotaxis protein CheD [Oscillospiraceae bacterium]|nr:chemotaxis protein CheD [Oscillospiraceae bacterium]MCL2278284.1 chemotaxis protein CheD [Oscillospiraceae bacterium]
MAVLVVGMADLKVAKAPDTLTTLGLGSCVGITLFDKKNKIGGMAHCMLPTYKGFEGQNKAKFVDSAVVELLNQMVRIGASRAGLVAKIAGGAHMFGKSQNNDLLKIGERNAAAGLAVLKQLSIPVQANDTGGTHGRTIELNPETGALSIKTVGLGTKSI